MDTTRLICVIVEGLHDENGLEKGRENGEHGGRGCLIPGRCGACASRLWGQLPGMTEGLSADRYAIKLGNRECRNPPILVVLLEYMSNLFKSELYWHMLLYQTSL